MFITVWEFRVRRPSRRAFMQIYGSSGAWAQLFRRAKGYLHTELLADPASELRFFTIDVWRSRKAFESAKKKFAKEYAALDVRCEALTTHETHVGSFELAGRK